MTSTLKYTLKAFLTLVLIVMLKCAIKAFLTVALIPSLKSVLRAVLVLALMTASTSPSFSRPTQHQSPSAEDADARITHLNATLDNAVVLYQSAGLLPFGIEEKHNRAYALLKQDEAIFGSVTLEAGKTYWIVVTSDLDFIDLDLELFDGQANLIAADFDPNQRPMVSVTPQRTGTFHFRVTRADTHQVNAAVVSAVLTKMPGMLV